MTMLAGEGLLRHQIVFAASGLILGTIDQVRAVLASETRYVLCHTIEARLLVPTAVVSVIVLLANASLLSFRRNSAASELISSDTDDEGTTSFNEVGMRAVMFEVAGECITVSIQAVFDKTIDR